MSRTDRGSLLDGGGAEAAPGKATLTRTRRRPTYSGDALAKRKAWGEKWGQEVADYWKRRRARERG